MKATVVVTSYNYEKFAVECVRSIADQTYQNMEIIFVDDGSSDNTNVLINDLKLDKLRILEKTNGGQLSAFNAALPHITGDLVFFIDADDMYEPSYLEKSVDFYRNNGDADFLFAGINYFGNTNKSSDVGINQSHGFSVCKTWFLRCWIGAPTSAISMRKSVLDKILPLELESDWKVRADDCLIWGASLVGAKKYFFGDAAIRYRVHGNNNFFGKQFNADDSFKRALGINRMFNLVAQKNHITITPDLLIWEFDAHPEKNTGVLLDYLKMTLMLNASFFKKVITALRIARRYFKRSKAFSVNA